MGLFEYWMSYPGWARTVVIIAEVAAQGLIFGWLLLSVPRVNIEVIPLSPNRTPTAETQNATAGRDMVNSQNTTTNNYNAPVFNVAPAAPPISENDIDRISARLAKQLQEQYPAGSTYVYATPHGFVVPSGALPDNFVVKDWSQGQVQVFEDHIEVVLPDITYSDSNVTLVMKEGPIVSLPKRVGMPMGVLADMTSSGRIEIGIIGIAKDNFTIGLGYAPASQARPPLPPWIMPPPPER